jgi:hypothetical protein
MQANQAVLRRVLAAAVAVTSVLALASCGSGGGSDALSTAGTRSTTPGSVTSTSRTAAQADPRCAAVDLAFLEPADKTQATDVSFEQFVAGVEAAAHLAHGEDLSKVTRMLSTFRQHPEAANGEGLTDAEATQLRADLDGLVPWANRTCPPRTAAWGCVLHDAFEPVGQAIDDGGDFIPASTSPTAEAEANDHEHDESTRFVIRRTPKLVVFGWRDARGLVMAVVDVVHSEASVGPDGKDVPAGWAMSRDAECNEPGASQRFETVGSSIPG